MLLKVRLSSSFLRRYVLVGAEPRLQIIAKSELRFSFTTHVSRGCRAGNVLNGFDWTETGMATPLKT